jgi:hypothetical protein
MYKLLLLLILLLLCTKTLVFIGITSAFLDESRHVIERHRTRVVGGFSEGGGLRPLCALRAAYFCILR